MPTLLASGAGKLLAGITRGIAALRPASKPLHPAGSVRRGVLVRHGVDTPTGVPWLDEPGTDDVLLRWSRAIGLPAPLPDIHGLAVRLVHPGRPPGDLLLATTGWSRLTRVVLLPGLSRWRPMTSLLPYATPSGAVLLGALPGERATSLHVASPWGPWQLFAELHEVEGPGADEQIDFDPVENPLPGLPFPPWVRRLREPAYQSARRSRSSSGEALR